MGQSDGKDDYHVLVIGAVYSSRKSLYQFFQPRLSSQLSIKCTLFERENYLNERLLDWNFQLYHAKPQFDECLPDHISNKLTSALSDPIRGLSEHDVFPMFNAQTGELLMKMPTPNALRLNRSRFRALIAEGLDIQYSKRLSSIDCPDDSSSVTARFEDGTAVTGNLLIVHDVPNASKPETWNWMYSLTWPDKDSPTPAGPEAIRQNWLSRAEKLAPSHCPYVGINRNGRVTLVGDAVHPMIYHRGQGLNNGILDAAFICRVVNTHCQDGKPITEALAVYEKEVQERGKAAVIASGRNSVMVHDWEQLKQSPVFTIGLKALQKAS
ncbi:MAG: hypothetical protein Q9210_000758 [Variospora velana]